MPRGADTGIFRRAALAAIMLALMQCAVAQTRVLYKWIDASGKQQYSDKPPVNFKGEVTRIDIDPEGQAAPPAAPVAKPATIAPDVMRDVTPPDVNATRKEKRERLAAAVEKARQKVAEAQAALDAGGDPKDDERRMVQHTFAKAQPGKSNCREVVDASGKKSVMCPQMIPNDEYYERMQGLEEALRKAQEELSDAQAAYRRGVD